MKKLLNEWKKYLNEFEEFEPPKEEPRKTEPLTTKKIVPPKETVPRAKENIQKDIDFALKAISAAQRNKFNAEYDKHAGGIAYYDKELKAAESALQKFVDELWRPKDRKTSAVKEPATTEQESKPPTDDWTKWFDDSPGFKPFLWTSDNFYEKGDYKGLKHNKLRFKNFEKIFKKYDSTIDKVSKGWTQPEEQRKLLKLFLIGTVGAETGHFPNRGYKLENPSGAKGLTQVKPKTARRLATTVLGMTSA